MPVQPARSWQPIVPPLAWFPWQSGRYYYAPNVGIGTSAALGVGTLRATPFVVPNAVTVTRIGAEIATVGDAGSVLRIGLYADDGTGRPGALVSDAGTIAGDSATVQEITVSLGLGPGTYWAASAVQVVTVTQPTVRVANGFGVPPIDAGPSAPTAATVFVSFNRTGIAGAFPDPFGTPTASGTGPPRLFLKVA